MNEIDLRRIDLNLLLTFEVLMAERNVTRAAVILGRTQSAVSHALSRLRDQLNDPILTKIDGRMLPSPMAIELIEQVKPILRSIQRVLTPRESFDPSTSKRVFRMATSDYAISLLPKLMTRIFAEAPSVSVDWVQPSMNMMLEVAEGQIDLAIAPAQLNRPYGISSLDLGSMKWQCYARRGHPAFENWGREAWSKWPHVVVSIADRLLNPVKAAATFAGVDRKVGVWVPQFSAVAPLLQHSNLLATLPNVIMADSLELFNIETRPTPMPVIPVDQSLIWSTRMTSDPAIIWLRNHAFEIMQDLLAKAHKDTMATPSITPT